MTHAYDDATVDAAVEVFCEARAQVDGARRAVAITQEAADLAVAIGITTSAARGEAGRAQMQRSALDHAAVAFLEHSRGVATQILPVVEAAEHYALHAEELRAMADASTHYGCRAALNQCAETYDLIAKSRSLVDASLLRLCQRASER